LRLQGGAVGGESRTQHRAWARAPHEARTSSVVEWRVRTAYRGVSMNMNKLLCGLVLLASAAPAFAAETSDCHIGSYRLADGSFVDIAPLDDGMLRWRRFDGSTGALHKAAD